MDQSISPSILGRSLIDHVKSLMRRLSNNRRLTVAVISTASIAAGWSVEKALDWSIGSYLEEEAEELQRSIDARTASIEVGVLDLQARLAESEQGTLSNQELQALAADAALLVDELHSLTPSLHAVGRISGDLASRSIEAKRQEIEWTGSSARPDFTLSVGTGVQLCLEDATFGIAHLGDAGDIVVNLSSLGEERRNGRAGVFNGVRMYPGEQFSAEVESGLIFVSYIGRIDSGSTPIFGFNVTCPGERDIG